jgi:MoxR-like ATPase
MLASQAGSSICYPDLKSMSDPSSFAPPPPIIAEPSAFEQAGELLRAMKAEIASVFAGQNAVVEQVLAALLAGGHVLLEGLPGLGKTHLVVALSKIVGGQFRRIQFTPDLMPSDVMGHSLFDLGKQEFRLKKGPIFANFVLADEINRAPAKTQSALLEVMQEQQVTIDGDTLPLGSPFMVLATQNPVEQEGTYPLPEAQLDRFLMKIIITYPTQQEEESIVTAAASGRAGQGLRADSVRTLCTPEMILKLQEQAAEVQAVPEVVSYAVRLTRATREMNGFSLGAGPRGAIALVRIAKAYALLAGRSFITPDDVKSAAFPVLQHRVSMNPELAISGQTTKQLLENLLKTVEAPRK